MSGKSLRNLDFYSKYLFFHEKVQRATEWVFWSQPPLKNLDELPHVSTVRCCTVTSKSE